MSQPRHVGGGHVSSREHDATICLDQATDSAAKQEVFHLRGTLMAEHGAWTAALEPACCPEASRSRKNYG